MTTGHRLFCKELLMFQHYAPSSDALTCALLRERERERERERGADPRAVRRFDDPASFQESLVNTTAECYFSVEA